MEARAKYNVGYRPTPPDGMLEKKLLEILELHTGIDQAITRKKLVGLLVSVGALSREAQYITNERRTRDAVNALRKKRYPICSTGGHGGGYWLAASAQEGVDYLDNEVRPRLKDLREQELAIEAAIREMWPQLGLGL